MDTPRAFAVIAALAGALLLAGCAGQRSERPERPHDLAKSRRGETSDSAAIRDVIRRFNSARLAAESSAQCALIDPATLRYLEQIDEPCEVLQGGTLTAESERDVRSRNIASIEIDGDNAVAHTRGLSGARDITLHRIEGRWFIRRP
jgi:hypothetical protein